MASSDEVAATLTSLDDAALIERWKRRSFSEEAMPIARAEFARRGLEAPEPVTLVARSAEVATSNYIFLRTTRALFGFIAGWQILGLLPVIGWLSELSATTGGMWAIAAVKTLTLIISGGIFFWLRTLINKLHTKKHGKPHPTMSTQWAL